MARYVELEHLVRRQGLVVERVLLVLGLLEVPAGERGHVHEHGAAHPQIGERHLERRRIHGDQHVQLVAHGRDVLGAEVDLERRDPIGGAGGRADLGRVVREGRQVAAGQGGLGGELEPGELHAVAGVAGEPDDHGVAHLALGARGGRGSHDVRAFLAER
jgi:hypothetical protein